MPTGQAVLATSLLDVGELDRVGDRLEARERDRSMQHAEQLVDALVMERTLRSAGMELSAGPQLALYLSCSEHRAELLLSDARVLQRLGALEQMRAGLLTVEQSRIVADQLGPLSDELGAALWERLVDRLHDDVDHGVVRPPARLRDLLQRWVIEADPDGYADRRRAIAEDSGDVELWHQDSGTVDLVARSLSAADAQACADRIEEHAQPFGPDDQRPAGVRRRDAARDLLLGRTALPFDVDTGEVVTGCCPAGSVAPCGATVFVHVLVDTALADSSQPAELIGHGPIDPAALQDLLLADPVLHRVWVDANGVPVTVDDRTWRPGRGDPDALRRALRDMTSGAPPSTTHPRHPDDHPDGRACDDTKTLRSTAPGARILRRPHLAEPGPYRPTERQKRLLRARAPRCEWPGCGRRASRAVAAGCDLDHDLAWPFGPTCACNLGPLCRRHHRIKQQGWIKQRTRTGDVRWTGPTGRTWTSPQQHLRPTPRPRHVAAGVWALAA